ncbi:class II fructose-1,6-bisphosphate aldolase [Ructibacterium gallinarum]|uniref:Class II fructose-1,6-bisphosphate aldolase n=1 Tax=Ructibacterium gallinarum TaxID=2779355 RepID=A0A9D5R947_9FIRM|nr:class II fructose-1,6-bisphosphate aldolase [Ructibacterium gallinarum]MBE5040104.1 class II fructose-1,6-bisphosphate aldolase [Ructibacterium gallinarum]
MLVTGKEILDHAHKNGYAVGAFNVVNMEMLQAVVNAAEEEKSPVFVQTTEGALSYAGIGYLSAMIRYAAEQVKVPVAFHLDHGGSFEVAMKCIRNGWTSVMIDGSHHPLEGNIEVTRRVVDAAHACGVSVEAELGRLGGVEDNISVDEKDAMYTDPEEAKKFVAETEVDYLAIAIGTAHGKYKGIPKLDFDRLATIKNDLKMPIVLHGASGVDEESIKKAIALGVNKINIDTELRCAYTDKNREIFAQQPDLFDLRKYIGPARENVKAKVIEKIRLFGSNGKA